MPPLWCHSKMKFMNFMFQSPKPEPGSSTSTQDSIKYKYSGPSHEQVHNYFSSAPLTIDNFQTSHIVDRWCNHCHCPTREDWWWWWWWKAAWHVAIWRQTAAFVVVWIEGKDDLLLPNKSCNQGWFHLRWHFWVKRMLNQLHSSSKSVQKMT